MLTNPRSNDDERMPQLKRRQTIKMMDHPTMRRAGMALCYGNRRLAQLLPPSIDDCVPTARPGRMV